MQRTPLHIRHLTAFAQRAASWLRLPAALASLTVATALTSNGLLPSEDTGTVDAANVTAYSFGQENSWVRVQNIGGANANVIVSYYGDGGALLAQDSCPSAACPALGPGQGWTFFTQNNPGLPLGYQGSAIVESDQPVVALYAKDIRRNGFFMIDGNTTTTLAGSSRMYLPLVANRDGGQSDSNGRFAVQNMTDTTACVTLTYLSNYTDGEVHWDPYKAGTSGRRQPGCPEGGLPIQPKGTLFRDPDNFGVRAPFTGSVRIETHKNAQGVEASNQILTASADNYNSIYNPFTSYRAIDDKEMSTTILLPLVDRQVGPYNGFSTRFQIENKDPSKPAQVTIRFEGFDLGNGGAFVAKQNTLTVRGARLCFQDRDDFANCLGAGDRLPGNWVGTAKITSTQPLGVIVSRGTAWADIATNYRGSRPEDAARRVLLPVLNKSYGPVAGLRGWDSWFRVLVADGGQANVCIIYKGLDLPNGEARYCKQVFRETTVFQFEEPFLPNGFAGTAILEADRPIVALANIYTDVFVGDPDLLYNGVPLP